MTNVEDIVLTFSMCMSVTFTSYDFSNFKFQYFINFKYQKVFDLTVIVIRSKKTLNNVVFVICPCLLNKSDLRIPTLVSR